MFSVFSHIFIKSTFFVFLLYIIPVSLITETHFFKAISDMDNKISYVGFLRHLHADSRSMCAIECSANCKCFGYNMKDNRCRLHYQIHCLDNFPTKSEEGWQYFCESGCCGGASIIHYLDGYVPVEPNFSIVNTSESYVGEKVNYTCAPRTLSVGRNQISCLETEKWETAMCEECTGADDPKQINYRGKRNVTMTGKTCQRWDAKSPHIPVFYIFPGNDENFCRNPSNHYGLWCYTTDPNTRWEDCNVPRC